MMRGAPRSKSGHCKGTDTILRSKSGSERRDTLGRFPFEFGFRPERERIGSRTRQLYFYEDLLARYLGASLSPTGLTPAVPDASELWDLSSLCGIARALVDSYFAMYYIAVEPVTMEERAFREAVWQYQGERKRLLLLRLIRSDSPKVPELDAMVVRLRDRLLSNPIYERLPTDRQKKVRDGDQPICLTNSELANRAGISGDYYKAAYRFLSSYVHTYPFALSQLILSRAGDPQTLGLFKMVLQCFVAFLSVAIRDYRSLFPDLSTLGDEQAESIVDDWIFVLGHCPTGSPQEGGGEGL